MKMGKSISEEGYKHFQMAIKALAISSDVAEALCILNAINMSGRMYYRDYYELYNVISMISAESQTGHCENCDTCKHKDDGWDSEHCDGCCGNHSGYEPQESEE